LAAGDPDLELARGLRSDDADVRRDALAALYERYSGRVFNVAWRVTGDWNRAQDVTQDVFLTLQDRIASWRGDAALGSWLYRLAVNRAIDHRRREQRRPAWRMGDDPLEEEVRRPRGEQAQAESGHPMEQEGEAAKVHEALQKLTPKLRAVLVLRYLEGLSYEELSEVLSCSLGTVKSRMNRAHRALKAALQPEDGADH